MLYSVKCIPFYQCVQLPEFANHTAASGKVKEMCPDSACLQNLYSTAAVLYAGMVLYESMADS